MISLVDSSPEQNDQNMGHEEEDKPATPPLPRVISLTTSSAKPEESSGKRSRPLGSVANDQEQPLTKKPSQLDLALEQQAMLHLISTPGNKHHAWA